MKGSRCEKSLPSLSSASRTPLTRKARQSVGHRIDGRCKKKNQIRLEKNKPLLMRMRIKGQG